MNTPLAPKLGSSWHYVLVHTKPPHRLDVQTIYAFYFEMMRASMASPTVAQAKLTWWAKELRVANLPNPHPLIGRLLRLIEYKSLDINWFINFILTLQKSVEPFYFANSDDILNFTSHTGGALCNMVAKIQDPEYSVDFATFAGISLTQIELIRRIGLQIKQHKMHIPLSDLAQLQVEPDNVLNNNISSEDWHKLMQIQVARARNYYAKALSALTSKQRTKQLNILIMLKLAHALLDEIEKTDFKLTDRQYYLTPLKKWWLAEKTCWQEYMGKITCKN